MVMMITISTMLDILELIGIVIVAGFIVSYLMWRVEREKDTPRISFKLFKEMYQLNPEKWSMYENYLYVKYDDNTSHRVDFNNFIDRLRYGRFRIKVRESENKQVRYNAEIELVNELQKEIDKYQKENIKEMEIHLEKGRDEKMTKLMRCGDGCKFWDKHASEQKGMCYILRQCTSDNFYCGNAKRREG